MARQVVVPALPFPALADVQGANRQSVLNSALIYENVTASSYSLALGALTYSEGLQALALRKGVQLALGTASYALALPVVRVAASRKISTAVVDYDVTIANVYPVVLVEAASYFTQIFDVGLTYAPVSTKIVIDPVSVAFDVEELTFHWLRDIPLVANDYAVAVQDIAFSRPNRSLALEVVTFALSIRPTHNSMSLGGLNCALTVGDLTLAVNQDAVWTRVEDVAEVWTRVSA